jgi:hypothetical protein
VAAYSDVVSDKASPLSLLIIQTCGHVTIYLNRFVWFSFDKNVVQLQWILSIHFGVPAISKIQKNESEKAFSKANSGPFNRRAKRQSDGNLSSLFASH